MDLPVVVIDVKGLSGAAIDTIEAGLTAQAKHNDEITTSWLKFAKGYGEAIKEGLPPAPDAFSLMSAKYADNMVAGGNYHAAADQLSQVVQLEENKIGITVASTTPIVVAGFDFSSLIHGEVKVANRLQFEVTVSTSDSFKEEAKKRLGVQDLAQQLNTIGDVMSRIQA